MAKSFLSKYFLKLYLRRHPKKKYGRVFGAKWSPVFGIWQRLGWQKTGDTLLVDI
jgi:hypothetical protein